MIPENSTNGQPVSAAAIPDPIASRISPPPPSTDGFPDLDSLRLSQNFHEVAGVKAVITSIACRKPTRHEFIRVRPEPDWRFSTGCFIDKQEREVYLIDRPMWEAMPGEVQPTLLLATIARSSPVPFLWPIPLPGPDGRTNRWHQSAIEAAAVAETRWARVVADMGAGCYVPWVASGDLPEPEWPDMSMQEYMRLAFRDRFVRDESHPIVRRLRGEV